MTVLLSSHLLAMVQSVCDRVALFREGKVGLTGTVPDIAGKVLGGIYVIEIEADGVDAGAVVGKLDGVRRVTPRKDSVQIDADRDIRGEIAAAVVAAGGRLKRLSMSQSSLDDVYVRYFRTQEMADAA
jgi:ABC-2 type transport system ATP-binding protein